ncbi:MAG: glycosyltransferase [Betaproteobacteria bacterium]|nr:glycosyltransferase [Betaproteobacteria bacterium]
MKPTVLIVMATYQGERYVQQQLESFAAQEHEAWELIITDDGSSDQTLKLIASVMDKPSLRSHKWSLIRGPGKGAAANFMTALIRAGQAIDQGHSSARYVALSDQDDIWLPTKLSAAVHDLNSLDSHHAALWCSSVFFWNDHNIQTTNQRSLSPARALGFDNALVQNIVRGNTVLLNRSAVDLVVKTQSDLPIVMHDWWLYLLLSGCGGNIIYSDEPSLLYRQHSTNVVGAASSWFERFNRFRFMLQGGFAPWNRMHLERLKEIHRRNPQLIQTRVADQLACFEHMLKANNVVERFNGLRRGGFYRQTIAENITLRLAVALGKF